VTAGVVVTSGKRRVVHKAHRPADPPFRRVLVTRISRTRVEAIFTVLSSDHPGRGILTLICAGKRNASNVFSVRR
jgi:hypothetical protein